jgi:hypothetical protein
MLGFGCCWGPGLAQVRGGWGPDEARRMGDTFQGPGVIEGLVIQACLRQCRLPQGITATVTATAAPSGSKRRQLRSGRKLQQAGGTTVIYVVVTIVPPGVTATNVGDITKQVSARQAGRADLGANGGTGLNDRTAQQEHWLVLCPSHALH